MNYQKHLREDQWGRWCSLPKEYGKWSGAHKRFKRWADYVIEAALQSGLKFRNLFKDIP